MRFWMAGFLLSGLSITALSGCTYLRLQSSVANQATTLADLHYQQVLNNLAMFSVNPYGIPSHVTIRDGSAQIQDFGSLSAAGAFGRAQGFLGTGSPGVTGSRTVVEQWGVGPVTDDIALRVLQIAYQRAFGMPVLMDLDLANDLARELSKQTAETSDIDQRNEFASTTRFRDAFAEQYAHSQFTKLQHVKPEKYLEKYMGAINTTKVFDHAGLSQVVGTNSKEIILSQEFLADATLASLDPLVYPAAGQDLPEGVVEHLFTPLAQSSRKDVKDTQDDLRSRIPDQAGSILFGS